MICPKCKEEGNTSKVYSGYGMTTCAGTMSYYDEQGKYHYHDSNITTSQATCSNGHRITMKSSSKCSSCDFGSNSDSVTVE